MTASATLTRERAFALSALVAPGDLDAYAHELNEARLLCDRAEMGLVLGRMIISAADSDFWAAIAEFLMERADAWQRGLGIVIVDVHDMLSAADKAERLPA